MNFSQKQFTFEKNDKKLNHNLLKMGVMLTYQNAQEIYRRNHGTTQYFKRYYTDNLVYTDGVLDFQQSF